MVSSDYKYSSVGSVIKRMRMQMLKDKRLSPSIHKFCYEFIYSGLSTDFDELSRIEWAIAHSNFPKIRRCNYESKH